MDADQWLLEVIVAWVYHKSVKIVVLLLLNMDWRSSCHMFPPARVCKSWCENPSGIHLYHLYFCMRRYRDIYMCTDYKHMNKQPSAILPSPTILQPPRINKNCLQPVEFSLRTTRRRKASKLVVAKLSPSSLHFHELWLLLVRPWPSKICPC